ncbi:hypothetical protein BUALT_Bualt06G0121700 [Buddleja alternifolia]|uniref:FAR1 domain-containing protein n=1 Tax=Buddleja alternifolia TaxID=168488 RepID=A0AAV6XQX1_9LAMI|nr:hypothetical protein BUALT_Bualt06G0121700 [Buddleja alternifolia]
MNIHGKFDPSNLGIAQVASQSDTSEFFPPIFSHFSASLLIHPRLPSPELLDLPSPHDSRPAVAGAHPFADTDSRSITLWQLKAKDNGSRSTPPNPSSKQCGLGDSSVLFIRLGIGQVMKSIEDTYLLYCKYAHAKGFGVKKGDQRYFTGTKEIQAKEFECSCQGTKDEKYSNDRVPVYQKLITRTGCKTRLRVGREKRGEWKGTRFMLEHNHEMKQNVMFGLAFMSDEIESSFEWLFRTFLKSMGGKQPETIFTDQCQAMMNVIDIVFPCAHHRLCQ